MNGYQHYVRANENNIVILGFTSGFPDIATPQPGDLLLSGYDDRHFHLQLLNERGQYKYKIVNGQLTERTQVELDEEWSNRPVSPTKEELLQQQIDEMKVTLGDFILFGGV